jgi:hypothetical protein
LSASGTQLVLALPHQSAAAPPPDARIDVVVPSARLRSVARSGRRLGAQVYACSEAMLY